MYNNITVGQVKAGPLLMGHSEEVAYGTLYSSAPTCPPVHKIAVSSRFQIQLKGEAALRISRNENPSARQL